MRRLVNKPNVTAPDSDFIYGRVRDKNGVIHGTRINELTFGDIIQFFEKLMTDGGITANELPDNAYNGFQLNQALIAKIAAMVATETSARTTADNTLQANISRLDFSYYSPSAIAGSGPKNIAAIDLAVFSGANILIRVDVSARNATVAGDGTWNEDVLAFRSNGGTLVQIGATGTVLNRTNGATAPTITYSIAGMVLTVVGNSSSGGALMSYTTRIQILNA